MLCVAEIWTATRVQSSSKKIVRDSRPRVQSLSSPLDILAMIALKLSLRSLISSCEYHDDASSSGV